MKMKRMVNVVGVHTGGERNAHIEDAQVAVILDQQIGRLDVAVQYAEAVQRP